MKLRYLMTHKDKQSRGKLAKKLKVSKTHLYRILKKGRKIGFLNLLKIKLGKKPKKINEEERQLVLRFHLHYGVAACSLERIILRETGRRIPHNRIHKFLKEAKRVMVLSKKRKNYTWVRYERERPNEVWHTDWTELEYKGRRMQLIAFLDDYSRFIVGYGLFDRATIENTLFVLRDALDQYGKPEAVMSDKGTQFYVAEKEGWTPTKNEFQKFLEAKGIQQITARVKHPQSNGKIERFFLTVKQHLHAFGDIHEFMHWYNTIKPHMSLDLYPPITRYRPKAKA